METLDTAANITSIIAVINEALEELKKCKGKQRPGYDTKELRQIEYYVQGLHQIFVHVLEIVADEVPLSLLRDYGVLNEVELLTKKSLAELLQFLRNTRFFSSFMRSKTLSEIGSGIGMARERGQIWLSTLEDSKLQGMKRRLKIRNPPREKPARKLIALGETRKTFQIPMKI